MNQCWNIVNWIIKNKFQWILNLNLYIFIQENAFKNVICKMAAILSRFQYVNSLTLLWQSVIQGSKAGSRATIVRQKLDHHEVSIWHKRQVPQALTRERTAEFPRWCGWRVIWNRYIVEAAGVFVIWGLQVKNLELKTKTGHMECWLFITMTS